jgi:hypothetical protein
MADPISLQDAVDDIPAGTPVRAKLNDGSEIRAVAGEGSALAVEGSGEVVDLDTVDQVLVDASSADPE